MQSGFRRDGSTHFSMRRPIRRGLLWSSSSRRPKTRTQSEKWRLVSRTATIIQFPAVRALAEALPMIVIMAGLPGTGKSTLARALSQCLPAAVLDKDSIRASLFQPAYVEYSRLQDDFCQEIMLQTAGYLL